MGATMPQMVVTGSLSLVMSTEARYKPQARKPNNPRVHGAVHRMRNIYATLYY